MSNYGRNFEFRRPPRASARDGRYATKVTDPALPIGVPAVVDLTAGENTMLMQVVKLAGEGLALGRGGDKGIALFEYGPAAFAGDDPNLVLYSDKDQIPPGAAIQFIHGDPMCKVVLRNTFDRSFLGVRPYPGRVIVAGLGATPTLKAGDFLVPGVGNDTDGYWKAGSQADAWLQVVRVDLVRAEVEALMLF